MTSRHARSRRRLVCGCVVTTGKGHPSHHHAGPELLALLGPDLPPGALCKGRAPWWDADVPGESPDERRGRLRAAAAVCSRCPVLDPCRAASGDEHATGALWGGRLAGVLGGNGQ